MTVNSPPEAALATAIGRLSRASVLVVGDAMMDRYVYGTVSRISPEAPVPVLAVAREVALPGGAGNVVRNLTALGAAAALVSVIGDDQAGSDLTGLIGGQLNVEPWLLVQGSRCTTVKTRFVAEGQQLLRSDQEITSPIHPRLADRMLRIAGDALAATSVTILSDYAKGVLAGDVPAKIIAAAREAGRTVVADPRGADLDRFAGADVVVLTQRGLEATFGAPARGEEELAAACRWLRKAHGWNAMVINRRAEGLFVSDPSGETAMAAASGAEMFDFTGVGDSVVAALAAGLACGLHLHEAAGVAALSITVSASQPGMAVATAADLLAMLTPQGRAMRKIMMPDAASEQIALWRQAGLRTGLVAPGDAAAIGADTLRRLRGRCDRLVVALSGHDGEPLATSEAAEALDLICPFGEASRQDILTVLRPDIVLEA